MITVIGILAVITVSALIVFNLDVHVVLGRAPCRARGLQTVTGSDLFLRVHGREIRQRCHLRWTKQAPGCDGRASTAFATGLSLQTDKVRTSRRWSQEPIGQIFIQWLSWSIAESNELTDDSVGNKSNQAQD